MVLHDAYSRRCRSQGRPQRILTPAPPLKHFCFRVIIKIVKSAAFEAERPIGGGTVTRLSAPSTGGQFIGGQGNPGGLVGLTRRGGGAGRGENKTLRVVVDLREFRSVLPNLLHQVRLLDFRFGNNINIGVASVVSEGLLLGRR